MTSEVEGRAANAKLGAAVVCDDGQVVYLAGVAEWPSGRVGQRVRVRGTREEREGRTRNEKGEVVAGWEGTATFLRNPVVLS
jgi:hypothetical protein